jgi:uncharacterized protein (UPF0333 family)
MDSIENKKAQGALEYLLLIGGALLIAVVVFLLISNLGGSNQDSSRALSVEAQTILDFSQPMEIVKIMTENQKCSDGEFGTFRVFL